MIRGVTEIENKLANRIFHIEKAWLINRVVTEERRDCLGN